MSLNISRILHAGYLFKYADTQIAFDPIFENPFSRNCYAFPDVTFDQAQIRQLQLDAVFISHFHDDHCSLESLNLLKRDTPIYLFCLHDELFAMIRELGFKYVYPLELGSTVEIGAIRTTPLRALDADMDSMFHIQAGDLNVLNVVDSWIDPDMLRALSATAWDLVLWPFQALREVEVLAPSRSAKSAMEVPGEWLEQLTTLNPKYVVASSCQFRHECWSWYNQALFGLTYRQFTAAVETVLPKTNVIRLAPSASIALDSVQIMMDSPLSWITPVGPTDADYEYRADTIPPSIPEIATHFPPLAPEDRERILKFCDHGLLEKFKAIGGSADPYFAKVRFWKLSLADHDGQQVDFHYRLMNDHIERVKGTEPACSWLTEIPLTKLHAALEHGESLTSLYLRINDCIFTPEIEREIAAADILEDPLIRCLYTGAFGSYQRAQLKKIKALLVHPAPISNSFQ